MPGPVSTRPFKKAEVLIFGAALGFFHHLVHLMPIGAIFSEIDQYLTRSAASALKFSCFGPYLNISGNGGLYIRVVLFVQLFENALSHPLSDAVFNDDHDKIKIYIFSL